MTNLFDSSQTLSSFSQERRQLTVVFCDLVDSSSLALNLDPEEFATILQAYQQTVSNVVSHFKGHIARYIGDGILIYFGYPAADETDAKRAILCCLELLQRMPEISVQGVEQRKLHVRIGVATGNVVIGEQDASYAGTSSLAIGNAPYIAARLQQAGKPDSLLISEDTHTLVSNDFDCLPCKSVVLKGAHSRLDVYEVKGIRVAHHNLIHSGQSEYCLGRKKELNQITSLLETANEGWVRLAIAGEPGIGKTALAGAVLRRASKASDNVINLQCSKIYSNNAYYPIIQYLRQEITRTQKGVSGSQIQAFLSELDIIEKATAEALAHLLSTNGNSLGIPSQDPFMVGEKLNQALCNVLYCLLYGARQDVLFVDDLQWVDRSTLAILQELSDKPMGANTLFIVTQRSGSDQEYIRANEFSVFNLALLEDRFILGIIDTLDVHSIIRHEDRKKICHKSGGNPLFAEELTKVILGPDTCHQIQDEGKTMHALLTPITLRDSIVARLDSLGDAKPIAQIASIIDKNIHENVLCDIISKLQPDTDVQCDMPVHIRQLMEHQIIVPLEHDERCFKFKHTLIQDTISRSLLRTTRKSHSNVIAHYFLDSGPHRNLYLSYHHFMQAENIEQSIRVLIPLVDNTIHDGSFQEAMSLVEEGLQLIDEALKESWYAQLKLQLMLRHGYVCMAIFGYGSLKCKEIFKQTLALAWALGDVEGEFRSIWGMARYSMLNSGLKEGKLHARRLIEIAQQQDSSIMLLESNLTIGVANLWLGNFNESLSNYNTVLACLSGLGDANMYLLYGEDPNVLCLSRMSFPLWVTGQTQSALTSCESALSHAREIDHPMSMIRAYTFKAWVHQFRFEVSATRELSQKVIELSAEYGHKFWQTCGELLQAWSMAHSDSIDEGIRRFEAALAVAKTTGTLGKTYQNAQLAELYLYAGDFENADLALQQAEQRALASGDGFWGAELLRLRGVILAAEESTYRTGLQLIFEAIEFARSASAHSLQLRAYLSYLDLQHDDDVRQKLLPELESCLENIQTNYSNHEYRAGMNWLKRS